MIHLEILLCESYSVLGLVFDSSRDFMEFIVLLTGTSTTGHWVCSAMESLADQLTSHPLKGLVGLDGPGGR